MTEYSITADYKTRKQAARVLKDSYLNFRCYFNFNKFGNELFFEAMDKFTFNKALKFLTGHKQKANSIKKYAVMKQVLIDEYVKL